MTTQNNLDFWKIPPGITTTVRILPTQPVETIPMHVINNMKIHDLPDSFDPIDWPVAKERFNKLRGFLYMYGNKYPRASKYGDFYSHEIDDITIGIMFGKHGFSIHIGEESFDFETGTDWVKTSDVGIVPKNFPILEEMMEFIADYHQL